MPHIQIMLDDEEDEIVAMFNIKYKLGDKRLAIKKMIRCFKIDSDVHVRNTIEDEGIFL